jgi:hypothetical protein
MNVQSFYPQGYAARLLRTGAKITPKGPAVGRICASSSVPGNFISFGSTSSKTIKDEQVTLGHDRSKPARREKPSLFYKSEQEL